MGSHIECLTLSSSEWPSAAAVCSLSDILETGELPQKYYLSPKACAGILRRAEKGEKRFPHSYRRPSFQSHRKRQSRNRCCCCWRIRG
jgi:hypothetical protein